MGLPAKVVLRERKQAPPPGAMVRSMFPSALVPPHAKTSRPSGRGSAVPPLLVLLLLSLLLLLLLLVLLLLLMLLLLLLLPLLLLLLLVMLLLMPLLRG